MERSRTCGGILPAGRTRGRCLAAAPAKALLALAIALSLPGPAAGAWAARPLPAETAVVAESRVAAQDIAPSSRERRLLAARAVLLREVRRCLGRPYVWGAAGPGAFDCSGLILWLYGRVGIRLPRLAVEQGRAGRRVRDRLRFGDVLLFKREGPGWHTGFYLARGRFAHAAGKDRGVIVSSLAEPRYRRMFRDARRYMGWQ